MTTITSSPSLSPKSFAAVPPHHSTPRSHHQYSHHSLRGGAATASPRSPSSPFARPRPSPTLAPRSPAVQHHNNNNAFSGSLGGAAQSNSTNSPLGGPAVVANAPQTSAAAAGTSAAFATNRDVQPSPSSIASTAARSAAPLASPLASAAAGARASLSPSLTATSHTSPNTALHHASQTTPTSAPPATYQAGTPDSHAQYRDFGTQYTPRGLPPTASAAGRKRASASSTLSSLSTSSFISNSLISTTNNNISLNGATARKRKDSSGGAGGGAGSGSGSGSAAHMAGDAMSLNTSSSGDVFMSEAAGSTSGAETSSAASISGSIIGAATPSDLAGRNSTSLAARMQQPGALAAAERRWNGSAGGAGAVNGEERGKEPQHHRSDSIASSASSSASSLVNSLPSPPKRSRPDMANARVLPNNYMDCDVRELGIIISDMLLELIRLNDRLPPREGFLTRFHSRAPPTISVRDYLSRLIIHATLSPPLLLAMVYYIDRLCNLYPAFTITSLTVHRFLITASTVAAKGLSDSFWTNHTYARVGGVSTKELAMLELDFLARLDWGIVPRAETLVDYYKSLVERADGYVLAEERPSGAGASSAG